MAAAKWKPQEIKKEEVPCETFEEGQIFTDEDGNECKATFSQMIELARKWLKEHTNIKNVRSVFNVKYDTKSENKQSPIRILNIFYENK